MRISTGQSSEVFLLQLVIRFSSRNTRWIAKATNVKFLQLLPLCKKKIVTSGDNLGPIQSCSDCKTNECSSLAAEVKADGVVGFLSFWPNWLPLSFPAPEKNLDIYSIISVVILSSKAFQHAYENSETKSRFNDKQSPTEICKLFFISRSPLFDKIVCSTAHSPFLGVLHKAVSLDWAKYVFRTISWLKDANQKKINKQRTKQDKQTQQITYNIWKHSLGLHFCRKTSQRRVTTFQHDPRFTQQHFAPNRLCV